MTTQLKTAKGLNKHFSKEDKQMTRKHMKRCSTSLATREMQVKTTGSYNLTTNRMVVIKMTKVGKNVKRLGPLYTAGRNVKWCSCFGKWSGTSSNC